MKKITPAIYIFSFFIAVVVMYWVMIKQDGATHEQALINALAGGIGMLIGLFLYGKFLKKGGDNDKMPD
ncbi:hypothetical protein GO491_02480 [Flavobacteriaceae bacterium Ap0902]|nr:hypothetical protein [Flavobacteriaceae bacterium Ap0902]